MTRQPAKRSSSNLSLGEFLPYRLSVVAETVSALIAKGYERQFGITIPEWRVLAVIGENGKLTTQQVIDHTRMDRVRVSRAVIRLADKGFLARIANPADARAQILAFSPAGAEIYQQIIPYARTIQRKLVDSLSPDEAKQLVVILQKLDVCAKLLDETTYPEL
ncbi:winged helix-turn-helix transcriptional regulator [Tardiphaga sp. vice352]|uniref:MarR family winged helix-turn-helix transcriptional regulator n=1 Tax=unclassified Tardiphaga TaxID=2631404 RepID=UPI0011640DB2|nr:MULTISPECIES: MarR family winged helix-turn-helix transcriptional regulator [unclassified Tardiphaga]QDM17188.1 winged helix-turn-helix transcriptional regulator [Tardiphaga sp. vice278]QDM27425.1 winged helix-turn-helix transcriptional regulator [Tardiphaga sp. vice304]QDM32551.1 winged helix-turn-helix transcriptional regulator [Tardiphaga sp. vice352]